MATGGTIPTKIEQSVSFYNTTSIIEQSKNMYYVPRFSKLAGLTAGTKVCSAWLSAFEGVCPPSSNYKDINIATWNPKDRSLVVKGNIDDFRVVTEVGACLNYFIITRKVYSSELVYKTYYYAFFILDVKQEGGASVRITAVADDFTNVFYLHNEHALTAPEIAIDYEPFNLAMKNCFVERQHYNRVTTIQEHITTMELIVTFEGTAPSVAEGEIVHLTFETSPQTTEVSGKIKTYQWLSDSELRFTLEDLSGTPVIGEPENFSTMTIGSLDYSFDYDPDDIDYITQTINHTERTNLNLFMNPQEDFPYRYQFRDLKFPISYQSEVTNFTKAEMSQIKNASSLSSLSSALKMKIARACLCWLVVETKGLEMVAPLYVKNVDGGTTYTNKYHLETGNMASANIWKPNLTIAFPFYLIPKQLKEIGRPVWVDLKAEEYPSFAVIGFPSTLDKVLKVLNSNAVADYILSASVVRDINIPDSTFINVSNTNSTVTLTLSLKGIGSLLPPSSNNDMNVSLYTGVYLGGLKTKVDTDDNAHVEVVYDGDTSRQALREVNAVAGIIVSNYPDKQMNFVIEEKDIPNLKSYYFDSYLEQKPYEFYSLSVLSSYELIFEKSRYYESNNVKVTRYLSFNEAIKEGFVPSYTVENCETEYFNEGLVYTVDSSVPLVSDSYYSYYNQNKAQMKNQYAVNDISTATQLGKIFATTPYSATGKALTGALKGLPDPTGISEGVGAGVGAINAYTEGFTSMIGAEVDWLGNKKTIDATQKAKLADVGSMPDSVKQAGSNVFYDCGTRELGAFFNHYTIDELSKNSICKYLERVGYLVNIYSSMNINNRVGWNYVKLISFDFASSKITTAQEVSIRRIFTQGVTLLHDKSFLTSGHNYETILE